MNTFKSIYLQVCVFTFFIWSTNIDCKAQSVETGFVKEYNGEKAKTPLAGVELSVSGAPSTVSDSQGKYELKFAVLKPGEIVKCNEIFKSGFVIFNTEALKAWRISNNRTPFVIIMCKESEFRALKRKFYGLIEKSYKEEYEKQKQETKDAIQDARELQSKLEKLEREYQEKLGNINTYVEVFSRIDHSEMSAIEAEALRLIEQGEIDAAIKKYEELELRKKSAEQLAKLETGTEVLRAGQEMVDVAHTDLLALAEKLKTRIGFYEMGGSKYNDKKKEDIAQLVSIYKSLRSTFGDAYNNELGKWMVSLNRYDLNNLKEAAGLPSYEGLYALGIAYEIYSIREDTLYEKARDCYQKALELFNPEDSVNKALERIKMLPNFSIKMANADIYYRIISEKDATVSICSKSLLQHNAPEGDLDIPATVTYHGKEYQIVSIDKEAFHNDTALYRVVIPASIQYIGKNAFMGTSLTHCTFMGDVKKIDEDELNRTIPFQAILSIPNKVRNMYDWLYFREAKMSKETNTGAYVSIVEYLINHKNTDLEDQIDYYEDLAELFSDNNSYRYDANRARDYYEKMIKLIEKANKEDKIDYYNNLYELFTDSASVMYDLDRAWLLLERIMKQNKKLNGSCYMGMGQICDLRQDYEQAWKYYNQAYKEKNYIALNNMAYMYAWGHGVPQDYQRAHALIDEAIESIERQSDLLDLYDSKGEIYLMQGDTVRAEIYCNKVLEKIKDIGIFVKKRTKDYMSGSKLHTTLYRTNENKDTLLQKYINVAIEVAKIEYDKLLKRNAITYPEYEELVSIGIMALQVLIENKTPEQLARYNMPYIAVAVRWAIRNELRIRYDWYNYYWVNSFSDDYNSHLKDSNDNDRFIITTTLYKTVWEIYLHNNRDSNKKGISEIIESARVIERCIMNSCSKQEKEIFLQFLNPNGNNIKEIANKYSIGWNETYEIILKTLNKIRDSFGKVGQNNNSDLQQFIIPEKYKPIIQAIALIEYLHVNNLGIEKEELERIGNLAIQVLIKNKTPEQLSKQNNIYLSTSVQWAIKNELSIRYVGYIDKGIVIGNDSLAGYDFNKFKVRVQVYRVVGELYNNRAIIEDTPFKTEMIKYASVILKYIESIETKNDGMIIYDAIFSEKTIDDIAREHQLSLHDCIVKINNMLNEIKNELNNNGHFGY